MCLYKYKSFFLKVVLSVVVVWMGRPYIRLFLCCQLFTSQHIIHLPTFTITSIPLPLTTFPNSNATYPSVFILSNSSNQFSIPLNSSSLTVMSSVPFQIQNSLLGNYLHLPLLNCSHRAPVITTHPTPPLVLK